MSKWLKLLIPCSSVCLFVFPNAAPTLSIRLSRRSDVVVFFMSNLNSQSLNSVGSFSAATQLLPCTLCTPFFLLLLPRPSTFIGQFGLYLIQAVSAAFYQCGKAWPFCLPPSRSPATCTLQISSGRRARSMAPRLPAEELSGDREGRMRRPKGGTRAGHAERRQPGAGKAGRRADGLEGFSAVNSDCQRRGVAAHFTNFLSPAEMWQINREF